MQEFYCSISPVVTVKCDPKISSMTLSQFNKNILVPLGLKLKKYAHAQINNSCYHILTRYEVETFIRNAP